MHCRSCELLTEDELSEVAGVVRAKAHFRTGIVEISYEGAEPSAEALSAAVRRAGYEIGRGERPWLTGDISEWVKTLFALGIVGTLFLIARGLGIFDLSLDSGVQLSSLPFVLLFGIVAGLSTCMAIVGGMVLAFSARYSERHPEATAWQKFSPHIFFNAGRILGFAFLGGLLGMVGASFQLSSFSVGALIVFVAGMMILIGLQLLELFPRLSAWKFMLPKSIAKALGIQSHAKKEYSHSRTLFAGAVTFFLPCGFTQAVQLFVVTQGSFALGFVTMGTFALGTAPGLLGIGGISAMAKGEFRRFFFKVAGVVVIALGVFNAHNGMTLLSLGSARVATQGVLGGGDANGAIGQDAQVVRITQKRDGYFPPQVSVKRGIPVRLIIDSQESYSCAVSLSIPKIGVRKILKPGENVFEFTPDQAGDIPFSCSMGMYRGVINVIE